MQFSKPLASAQTQAHGPGQQQLKGQEGTRRDKKKKMAAHGRPIIQRPNGTTQILPRHGYLSNPFLIGYFYVLRS